MEDEMPVYIRPCGALPDGIETDHDTINLLVRRDLVVPSSEYEGDYEAIYDPFDDEEVDRVGWEIIRLVQQSKVYVSREPAYADSIAAHRPRRNRERADGLYG